MNVPSDAMSKYFKMDPEESKKAAPTEFLNDILTYGLLFAQAFTVYTLAGK